MTRSEFDRKYTSQLNPQQLAAVHAVDGAVLLLAVPGSGKTTVLVTRLGYMLCCCGISPVAILTMTYGHQGNAETVRPAFWSGLSAGPGDPHDQRRFL